MPHLPQRKAEAMRPRTGGRVGTAVVSFFGFMLCALFIFYAVPPWLEHNEIPFFGLRFRDTALFSILGLSSLSVTVQLLRGKRWAWWCALAVSVLTLSLAMVLLVLTLHPRDDFARSEGGFGFFLSLCLMLPGAASAILLTLPATRQRFRAVK
jgi:hypothetical protein